MRELWRRSTGAALALFGAVGTGCTFHTYESASGGPSESSGGTLGFPPPPVAGAPTKPPDGGAPGGAAGAPPVPVPDDLAAEIEISKISVYQGVEVPLSIDGAAALAMAPVVEGRDAMVRVFVEPKSRWKDREIVAELEFSSVDPKVKRDRSSAQHVTRPSIDPELASTFNFRIPGEQITRDLGYRVSLRETAANEDVSLGQVHPGAAFPRDGSLAELGALSAGPLRVTVVPLRYFGDGSGRLPDTSEPALRGYRDGLKSRFPTNRLVFTLREAVDYHQYLGPESGWVRLLDTVCALRESDGADTKTYYYGLVSPFPNQGPLFEGTVGIGYLAPASSSEFRCSVGADLPELGADIMAHELGHNLGRPHAPCGVYGPPFPHFDASIGVWGYDTIRDELKDPALYRDFMSYCEPAWISDFTYARIFERIRWVNANQRVAVGPAVTYRRILVDVDGSQHWGRTLTMNGAPSTETLRVNLYGEGGRIGETEGYVVRYSEEPALEVLFPAPAADVRAVEANGLRRMQLP